MNKEFKYLKYNFKYTFIFVTLVAILAFLLSMIIVLYSTTSMLFDEIENQDIYEIVVESSSESGFDYLFDTIDKSDINDSIIPIYFSKTYLSIDEMGIYQLPLVSIKTDISEYFQINGIKINEDIKPLNDYDVIIPESALSDYNLYIGKEISFSTEGSLTNSWDLPTLKIVNTYDDSDLSSKVIYSNYDTIKEINSITGDKLSLELSFYTQDRNTMLDSLEYFYHNQDNEYVSYTYYLNNALYNNAINPILTTLSQLSRLLLFVIPLVLIMYAIFYSKAMKKRSFEIKYYYYLGLRFYNVLLIFLKENIIIVISGLIIGHILSIVISSIYFSFLSGQITIYRIKLSIIEFYNVLENGAVEIMLYYLFIFIVMLLIQIIIYNIHVKKVKLNV